MSSVPGRARGSQPHAVPPLAVRSLRQSRFLHRYLGLVLAALVLLSSVTGVVLAWKKNSDALQPATQTGATTDMARWQSWSAVQQAAVAALASHLRRPAAELEVDRFDARPGDGIVKVLFTEGSWEVQIDPATLQARSVARRHSDWIETVHDLSIVSDAVKLVSMNLLGLGLIVIAASGIWIWYGPRWVRSHKHSSH